MDIVQATRDASLFQFGVSTRAAIMFQRALKAYALLQEREFVNEDDVKTIAPHVLLHRLRFQGGIRNSEEAFNEFLAPHIEKLVRS